MTARGARLQRFASVHALISAYQRGARPHLRFSKHAAERYQEMRLTEDELFATIARPQSIVLSKKYLAMNLQGGRIAIGVVIDHDGVPLVNTILWWTQQDWNEAAQRGDIGNGRVLRQGAPTMKKGQLA